VWNIAHAKSRRGAGSGARADFEHKMSVCLKELRESRGWLRLIERVPLLKNSDNCQRMIRETEELIRIFFTSLRTSKTKRSRK
jgi:four helix bundle protein